MRSFSQTVEFTIVPEQVFVPPAVLWIVEHVANRARVELLAAFRDAARIIECGSNRSKRQPYRTHIRNLPNDLTLGVVDQQPSF